MSVDSTPTAIGDLAVPCFIDHVTFLGRRQIKRVDSVTAVRPGTVDPRVRDTLGVGDLSRPLVCLTGDTVDLDNRPVGVMRGWRTYVYADEPLDVCNAPARSVGEALERGEEHVARERYGDDLVDRVIRAALEADGWDADACFKHANGYGS